MNDDATLTAGHDRRSFLGYFTAIGLGGTLLPGVLWARAAGGEEITAATIACAEEISGLRFTDEQRQQMLDGLKNQESQIEQLHAIKLDNSVAPAVYFDPVPPGVTLTLPTKHASVRSRVSPRTVPRDLEELAFLPVTELAELVRRRKITSTQLTEMYLGRIKRYDPVLKAVITLTEERARRQAKAADEEIARGKYRGPLHGIPWGAKDLLAVKGYKTTWGAAPYRDQVIDVDATVVQRLDDAGAVLLAKLTPRVARRPARRRPRPRGWSASRSARRRSAPSRHHPHATASPDSARRSAGCRAPAPWRSRGRWTRSAPSPARWRTARSCSRRFTDRTTWTGR